MHYNLQAQASGFWVAKRLYLMVPSLQASAKQKPMWQGTRQQNGVTAVRVPSLVALIVSISLTGASTLLYHIIEFSAFILPEKQRTTFSLITEEKHDGTSHF